MVFFLQLALLVWSVVLHPKSPLRWAASGGCLQEEPRPAPGGKSGRVRTTEQNRKPEAKRPETRKTKKWNEHRYTLSAQRRRSGRLWGQWAGANDRKADFPPPFPRQRRVWRVSSPAKSF